MCLKFERLKAINDMDAQELMVKDKDYGSSWKKRGGVDSFMMLARKWDRIEHQVKSKGYNILKACEEDTRKEGILDDVRDLRRYLLLVEHEILERLEASEPAAAYVDPDTDEPMPPCNRPA